MPTEAIVCTNVHKDFWQAKARREKKEAVRRHLTWRRVQKTRKRAVDGVTVSIGEAEIFGILGPNGSGKSTLIRLISTLLTPDSGSIAVFGHDVVRDQLAVRRHINRVSVEAAFFKKLSPMENLRYAARLYAVPVGQAEARAREILGSLGLSLAELTGSMENLSRGMQQKVAVARALLTSPVLLLLDEPTTGLDPKSKRDVQAFVREIRDTHRTTVILTTHDMVEAEKLCDRIAFINNGRFVALDTVPGLKKRFGEGEDDTLEDVFIQVTGRDWEEEA